ncbi:MAG: methyltransferase domain-containing protein [Oscillospiraceae bacterium]|nr:methyltransferase domain-containing protein [Oscillospiraceae bacterium]MCL2279070.1 methyltransferase domain-containing protein [Oscillospiraceae bacterium]
MAHKNNAVDYFSFSNPFLKLRSKFALRAREKIFYQFMSHMSPTEDCLVLDMGVTPDCSLPESNFFEHMYPHTKNITMCTFEDASNLLKVFDGAAFVQMDSSSRVFPFDDKSFDILFCSAVLEHVGSRENQAFFIEECLRVAKKIFLTTPNRWFPVEMHTIIPLIHWLPQGAHRKLLRMLGLDFWAKTENLNLLSAKQLLLSVPEKHQGLAKIYKHRTLGFVSNLILAYPAQTESA